MHKKKKAFFKELIDFHEANGCIPWKTIRHFVRNKRCSEYVARRWLKLYESDGRALVDKKTTRKKLERYTSQSVETAKRVLELLKEDPNVSNTEGGAMLNMSKAGFAKHKKKLMTSLTPAMKIQLGLMCGTLPENVKKHEDDGKSINKMEVLDDNDNDDDGGHVFKDERISADDHQDQEEQGRSKGQLKEKKKASRSRHCLVCNDRLGVKKCTLETPKIVRRNSRRYIDNPPVPIITSSFANDCGDDGELGENLNVIFALKNIFGLNSSDLVNIMKATNGKDPKEWYNLCQTCDVMLKEAISIQHQVLQLSRELEKCKKRIHDTVKKNGQSSKFKGDEDNLLVAKVIKESIMRPKTDMTDLSSAIHFSVAVNASLVKQEPRDDEDGLDLLQADDYDWGSAPIVQANDVPEDSTEAGAIGKTVEAVAGDSIIGLLELPKTPTLVVCETCGEEMRLVQLPMHSFRVHDIIMEGFTVFKCHKEGCKYSSFVKDNFKRHVQDVHTPYEKRKHVCRGKRFPRRGKLDEHEKVHKNAITRPYQCEICGSSFALYSTLYSHRRCVHEKNPKYTTRKKRDPATPSKPRISRTKVKNDTVTTKTTTGILEATDHADNNAVALLMS